MTLSFVVVVVVVVMLMAVMVMVVVVVVVVMVVEGVIMVVVVVVIMVKVAVVHARCRPPIKTSAHQICLGTPLPALALPCLAPGYLPSRLPLSRHRPSSSKCTWDLSCHVHW